MYKLLKDSLKIRRYLLVTILVIQFISVILSTLLPYMNGMFVDMLIDIKNVEEVIKYAITIAGVGIISLFLSYIYNLKIMKVRVTDIMQVGFLENIPEKIIDNIQIGVEAGYNEGLKKVRKGITIAQLEECAEHLYELDLQDKAFFSFIIGFPWETITEIKSTISTAAYLYDNFKILANIN